MNISNALIERYHQNLCTPEETEAVEKWLEAVDGDEYELPYDIAIDAIKMEVWKELEPHVVSAKSKRRRAWKYAGMAATAMLMAFAAASYFIGHSKDINTVLAGSLSQEVLSPHNNDALKIEFGSESGASYSQKDKMLNFCGVIKITPKENMKLSFTSLCDGNRETTKEIDIKGGTTYFAMDLKHRNSSELVVMDKNMVGELPPIVQNSLIAQFGI